jgi:hypothetical protein
MALHSFLFQMQSGSEMSSSLLKITQEVNKGSSIEPTFPMPILPLSSAQAADCRTNGERMRRLVLLTHPLLLLFASSLLCFVPREVGGGTCMALIALFPTENPTVLFVCGKANFLPT